MTAGFKAVLIAILVIQLVQSYALLSLQVEVHQLVPPSSDSAPWWVWTSWTGW